MLTHDFLAHTRRWSHVGNRVANTIEAMGAIICSCRVIKISDLEVVKALSANATDHAGADVGELIDHRISASQPIPAAPRASGLPRPIKMAAAPA
jgi:hypothetical protein